jgi:hypothetical protein
LVLENMDSRKPTGRTAAELEPFFEQLPDAGFCLDIAHAYSIDPSMAVFNDLLDRYRSRDCVRSISVLYATDLASS